jgi:primosomal protein N' (replication factor Y)
VGADHAGRRDEVGARALSTDEPAAPPRVVRVLPDRPGINKLFDYTVPADLDARAAVGSVVRVELHGRRIGGWIVADDVEPPPGVPLKPIAKWSSAGPTPELIELADWAAWRWAGAPAHFLRTASPERNVTAVLARRGPGLSGTGFDVEVLRLPPTTSPYDRIVERSGPATLVLVPALVTAQRLVNKLKRDGIAAVLYPEEWQAVRSGDYTVVGTRSAAWAPMPQLRSITLVDEHDEVWQQESAPTWHARDVVVERARRRHCRCTLISPSPSLEALQLATPNVVSRDEERGGWPVLQVVDRHDEAPGAPLLSDELTRLVRGDGRIVCVLNRKGRSRLLACASCNEIARCEACDAAVTQEADREMVCLQCGTRRPLICLKCGASKFRNLRAGVARLREELEALARKPVVEVTGDSTEPVPDDAMILIGTEAVLHRVAHADAVVFLDFDQELLAPRYRAAEEALALLIRAARLVGSRTGGGRVVVQTRLPQHETIQAALHGDPDRLVAREQARRSLLQYPPYAAVAVVSGVGAPTFIDTLGRPLGVDVLGPTDGTWMLRAATHEPLLDALAATPRPSGRLRVAVDPLRL